MKKVLVIGLGPSVAALENADIDDIEDVVLINDNTSLCKNKKIVEKLKNKNIYIISNIGQEGFNNTVFSTLDIKQCYINRLTPDWELWEEFKHNQRKYHQGGHVNNIGYLPYLSEDEPYINCWRGPKGRNKENMKTRDGRLIKHLPESVEEYLIPVYSDKVICNCSYYASLLAIKVIGAEKIVYYGIDFYSNLKIKKSWYVDPPRYGNRDWYDLRVKIEGEHLKYIFDQHLAKLFPALQIELYTSIEDCFDSKNIKCNTVGVENRRYY